jgi:hypothetical protein
MGRPKGAINFNWLPTNYAAASLGISARQLRKLKAGMKLGVHYRIISSRSAARPTYQWNVDKVAEYLQTPLEKR